MPPLSMWLYVASPGHRKVRLWLPLFLLWLLLLPFVVIALVVAVIVDSVLWIGGQRYHHYTLLLVRCLELISDTRGLVVSVNADAPGEDSSEVHVAIS